MISLQISSETRIWSDSKISFFDEAKTDKYKIQINSSMFTEIQECADCDESKIKW